MTLSFSRVTLAAPLHTLEEVKTHLQITDADHDDDVAQKYAAAAEFVLAYLGPAGDAGWTPTTAPQQVKNAMLLLTTHYYEHRGDDLGAARPVEAVIWKELQNALAMYRDPALA